ncbi:MAG: glycosyltransferase family 9 protein [bacterium]
MKFEKILIIRLSSIGDVLLTTPIIKALREKYKNSYIAFVVEPKSYEIIKDNSYLDKIFIFHKQEFEQKLKKNIKNLPIVFQEIKDFVAKIKEEKFDLVIDLHNVDRSAFLSIFSKAKYKIGDNKQLLNIFLNKKIKTSGRKKHIVENYLEIVKSLGIMEIEKKPNINFLEEDENFANVFLKKYSIQPKKLIGINPFASWPTNLWVPQYYAKVIDFLNCKGYSTIIFGQNENNPYLKEVINSLKTTSIIAIGKTNLTQLAALIKQCSLLITPDTGPMHIATAVGTKVLALFGPANPISTGPLGENNLVIKKNFFCQPCFKKKCADNICMKKILPEEVISVFEQKLEFFF